MAMDTTLFQDVIGQFPQPMSYNHGLMICALGDDVAHESVVTALETAIAQIVEKIPWLGEQVCHETGESGSSGKFKTAPCTDPNKPKMLYVKDCRDLCRSFDEIVQAGGPVSMLDGEALCPLPGFPLGYDEAKIGPAPVVAVQASFIKGGVILNFSNQHNVMDASGVFAFVALLSIAMQGNELPKSLVDQANLDRAKVIPLLGPGQPVRDHSHLFVKSTAKPATPPTPSSRARWAFFLLPKTAIASIEADASDTLDFDPAVSHISANDALCAFYWKRLAAVRLARGTVTPADTSKFLRAIDARSPVGVPPGYMGQMVYHASTRLTYGQLVDNDEWSASALASRMRADLNESNNEWAVRSYVTFLAGVPDKARLVYGGGVDPRLDVGSSSMSQGTTGSLNFGVLGKPALIRRANLLPVPGMLYFYPPEPESGDLPLLTCLTEGDLEGLREDGEWKRYARFTG